MGQGLRECRNMPRRGLRIPGWSPVRVAFGFGLSSRVVLCVFQFADTHALRLCVWRLLSVVKACVFQEVKASGPVVFRVEGAWLVWLVIHLMVNLSRRTM